MKLIKFFIVIAACTFLVIPLLLLALDACMEGEESFLFKMYKDI